MPRATEKVRARARTRAGARRELGRGGGWDLLVDKKEIEADPDELLEQLLRKLNQVLAKLIGIAIQTLLVRTTTEVRHRLQL